VPKANESDEPLKPGSSQKDKFLPPSLPNHADFVMALRRHQTRFLVEMAPRVWSHGKQLAASVTGVGEHRSLKCAFWMFGSISGRATWVEGPEESGVSDRLDETVAEMIDAVRLHGQAQGERPLCLVQVLFHGKLAASADSWGEEKELGAFRRELVAAGVSPQSPDLRELEQFASSLPASDDASGFRVVLEADERVHRALGLRADAGIHPSGRVALWNPVGLFRAGEILATWLAAGQADLFIHLTTESLECERRWVREERKEQVQVAASEFLDLFAQDQHTGLPTDPRGVLPEATLLWQAVRSVVKEWLENVIVVHANLKLDTYEEKQRVTEGLTAAMHQWGFVAIAPASGLPSYLRCRQTTKNPRGFFYFESLPGVEEASPPQADAKSTPVKLPAFKLTDLLPTHAIETQTRINPAQLPD